ncbi:MAG TPA: hypothetical protein ENI20_10830 [Bacteroides sp.]|nr:hypothetical protein [Bacteroides sp.]
MKMISPVKKVLALLLIILPHMTMLAQQPVSPLVASFEMHRLMKMETVFKLDWISLGPTLNSARVEAVQLDPEHPGTMYIAFGSGNLWKSVNHGISWKPIFEGQPSLGIGDFALAPSNPNIIYVGTGESLKKARNFTMPGTGIYRSDDAGETWRHLGLDDSWHIGEIAVHPHNPDIVLVSVLGHFWSKNENRGVFRTNDGGESWKQVLYNDDQTGANDIVISPSDPDILYASMWENNPGVSGPNSGVYRSSDGGKTWSARNIGLPQGYGTGRMGLAVSYTNPDKAYVLVDNRSNENDDAAEVYKTLDGGLHWERTHQEDLKIFSVIGWYFTDIYVSPANDDEIFALGVRLAHSADGGKTFAIMGGDVAHITPSAAHGLHLDHCELWIHPGNPDHLALGNDGGLYISYDRGKSWMHYNNIPAGEFYDITLDHQTPYQIYGGVQDDATVYGPPEEWNPAFPDRWKYLWIDAWNGGDGCVTQVDPEDPNTVYFSAQNGAARRLNMAIDSSTSIRPELPEEYGDSLRFNFVTPYFISAHHSKTLYHAGNFVFKSTDRGDHWELISGDLSLSSVETKKSTAAGALAESPLQPGLLYLGTDRGAFWVSQDDGLSWKEQSKGIPDNYILSICPSRFNKKRVYMAITGINYDDLGNYLYVSENYGENWRSLGSKLPDEPANVILEDPTNENILYAGMYRGVYISTDRGNQWSYLGKNMPAASIADMEIHEPSMDLIAATHGRGIYKMNIKPIQTGYSDKAGPEENHLFKIPAVHRPWQNDTRGKPDYRTLKKVPISFWLSTSQQVSLELMNPGNELVWSTRLDGQEGFNEIRWDLIYKREDSDQPYFIHYETFLESGSYSMQLLVGKDTLSRELIILDGKSPNLY